MADTESRQSETSKEFARQAQGSSDNLFREVFGFMRENKKWWLTPIIVGLLIVGAIVVLGGTAMAPFIYATF